MNYNKWKKFKHIKLKPNNLDDMETKNFANKINHLPKEVRAYSKSFITIILYIIMEEENLKNTKKWALVISSKTEEPLKPFIKPRDGILRGILIIAFGYWWYWMYISYSWGTLPVFTGLLIFSFYSIVGGIFISRAKLGNKHVLAHQILNWALPISSKTEEPLKPFTTPGEALLLGIINIAVGFLYLGGASWGVFPVYTYFSSFLFLIVGGIFISRAKLGNKHVLVHHGAKLTNKHVLVHQRIILIGHLFLLIMGVVFSIFLWSIFGLLGMVGGIIIIIVVSLYSIIHCLYWLVKLEKYKVKN